MGKMARREIETCFCPFCNNTYISPTGLGWHLITMHRDKLCEHKRERPMTLDELMRDFASKLERMEDQIAAILDNTRVRLNREKGGIYER